MSLCHRLKTILKERSLKQVDFARSLGISPNYVNQLVNGKKEQLSETLAKLIEETYGFSAHWVMTGEGAPIASSPQSPGKMALLKKIQTMSDHEIIALLAFADSLDRVKKLMDSAHEEASPSAKAER